MAPTPIPLSSVPTLSSLYKASTILPPPQNAELPIPSATLNSKISLIRTSITDLKVTCIVNAANESLLGGGGVDGAIHRAAGSSLLAACRKLNGCDTGSAKITEGFKLPASYIIHAVGPVYSSAKLESPSLPAELLAGCYEKSLELAAEKGGSIAFSCLSTGVYGYPSGEAAEVAVQVVRDWLLQEEENGKKGLERVVFCVFEEKDDRAYKALIPKYFPPTQSDLSSVSDKDNTVSTPATAPSSSSGLLDTQASSLLAAATNSANNEQPTTKKLKVTNPDTNKDSEEWQTIEKPEDFLEADKEDREIASTAKGVEKAIPEQVEEKPALEAKEDDRGNLGKNSLLKDW